MVCRAIGPIDVARIVGLSGVKSRNVRRISVNAALGEENLTTKWCILKYI